MDNEVRHIEESDRLNYGTFYRPDAWLVMRSSAPAISVRRATKKRQQLHLNCASAVKS